MAEERSRREGRRRGKQQEQQRAAEVEGMMLPKSVSALKQAEKEELKRTWAKRWSSSTVGAALRAIDPRPPGPAYNAPFHSLSSANLALLTRLRTNFSDLGATKPFLPLDSPERLCACGAQETREHYLMECEKYEEARGESFEEMKKEGWRPKKGSNPGLVDIFLPRYTAPLLRYIHSTQRFPHLFCRVDSPPPPPSSLSKG
jgi:hypothetical protein